MEGHKIHTRYLSTKIIVLWTCNRNLFVTCFVPENCRRKESSPFRGPRRNGDFYPCEPLSATGWNISVLGDEIQLPKFF